MTKNEQVVVLKVNNHKKLQVLQSLANKVTNEIDQVIRGFLFYNINYKGYKFKREVPLNVANNHRLHLNLRAMTKASKKYEFLNEVNKEKIKAEDIVFLLKMRLFLIQFNKSIKQAFSALKKEQSIVNVSYDNVTKPVYECFSIHSTIWESCFQNVERSMEYCPSFNNLSNALHILKGNDCELENITKTQAVALSEKVANKENVQELQALKDFMGACEEFAYSNHFELMNKLGLTFDFRVHNIYLKGDFNQKTLHTYRFKDNADEFFDEIKGAVEARKKQLKDKFHQNFTKEEIDFLLQEESKGFNKE